MHLLDRARRRGRITESEIDRALTVIGTLPITMVPRTELALLEIQQQSLRSGLNSYDVAYLELARTRTLPLATMDAKLAQAARASGLSVMP